MSEPRIHVHTASAASFHVRSYLVETANGVVAIDTPFTVSDARALRARLDALAKPLLAVLLTHAHPDHVNGTAILTEGTGAPILATAAVDATLREIDGPKRDFWAPIYGDEYPPFTAFPTRLVADGELLDFGGATFRVLDLGPGEGAAETAFVLPEARAAFIGDVAYHGVHMWLAEGRSAAWLAQLDEAERRLAGVDVLYPGHGAPAGFDLLAWQRDYLRTYRAAVADLLRERGALDDAAKAELRARMVAFAPDAPLADWVPYGAEPVAAELAAPVA